MLSQYDKHNKSVWNNRLQSTWIIIWRNWTKFWLSIWRSYLFCPKFMNHRHFFFLSFTSRNSKQIFRTKTHWLWKFQLAKQAKDSNIHPVAKITTKSRNQTQIRAKDILLTQNVIKSMGSPTREELQQNE